MIGVQLDIIVVVTVWGRYFNAVKLVFAIAAVVGPFLGLKVGTVFLGWGWRFVLTAGHCPEKKEARKQTG